MLVWPIEAALERARLFLALSAARAPRREPKQKSHAEAQSSERDYLTRTREKLAEAKRLIRQTERPYEPHRPDWPNWQPPPYVGVFKQGQIVGYHRCDPELAALEEMLK